MTRYMSIGCDETPLRTHRTPVIYIEVLNVAQDLLIRTKLKLCVKNGQLCKLCRNTTVRCAASNNTVKYTISGNLLNKPEYITLTI